jgi:cardiolipin synthase
VPDLCWDPARAGNTHVLILPSGPADDLETCGLFYTHCIHQARRRVWIVSPYFVPDEAVTSALHLAALRGVDVRILMPQKPDSKLVALAAFSYVDDAAAAAGIRFHLYRKGFLHQKVILVDDSLAAVGTANLDNRSLRLNFEITAIVADTSFAREVEAMLAQDFEDAPIIRASDWQRRPLPFRIAVRAARLLSPVL